MSWDDDYYEDEVYGHCRKTGDFSEEITQELCGGCTYSSCEFYPDKIKKRYEGLERLRSSELSNSILQSACKLFALTEEEAEEHLLSLFSNMQSIIDVQVKNMVEDAIASRTVRYLDEKMGSMLDALFEEAVSEKIVTVQKDKTAMLKSVQMEAHAQMKTYFDSQHTNRCKSDTVQVAMEKVIGEKVKDVMDEIKKESIEKFSKEAMKKMMTGMANAIHDDKRLLAMMTEI